MRYFAILLTLLCIAATPQLIVDMTFTQDGQANIDGYERSQGDDPTRTTGEWTLQLTRTDEILAQTQFSPTIITASGDVSYLEQISVPILFTPAATSIEVLDGQGTLIDAYPITGVCGDNLCEVNERGSCSEDCAQEAVDAYTQEAVQEESSRFGFWAAIAGIVLLIIVLLLVLLHVNRKKESPVQMQY